MKKIFLIILIAFTYLTATAQNNSFSLTVASINTPKASGAPFSIEFNYVGTTKNNCKSQKAIINIGKLVYVPNLNILSTAIATQSVDGEDNIITIDNLPSSVGSSRILSIGAMFAPGVTCDNTIALISGELFQCEELQGKATEIKVTSQTLNVAKASITQQTSYDQQDGTSFCMGKIVRYTVKLDNPGNSGFNITTPRVFVNLTKCASIIGVYKYNSYTPVEGSYEVIEVDNNKVLSWDVPDLNMQKGITFNSNLTYQIDVQYPCTNPSSCIGDNQLKVYLEGFSCDQLIRSVANTAYDTIVTKLTSQCEPTTPCGGGEGAYAKFSYNLYCPKGCTENAISHININFVTPPLNPTQPNRQFKITIPDGIRVENASIDYGLNCPEITKTYLDQNNEPTQPSSSKYIIFDVPCESISYETKIYVYFKYSNPTSVTSGDQFTFKAGSYSGTTPLVSERDFIATVRQCGPYILIEKQLKGTDVNDQFYKEYAGLPREEFIYRVKVNNTGSYTQQNIDIKDILDPSLIYKGDFKIVYTDNQNLVSVPNLNSSNTYKIEENNIISVTTPPIGSNGTILLNNFNLPCSLTKYLIFEFRVQVKENVSTQQIITNKVQALNNSINSNDTKIIIGSNGNLDTEMFVKCSGTSEWVKDYVTVKNGQQVEIKLKFKNAGTKKVFLADLVNLRPQSSDKYETNDGDRNANIPFTINYECVPVTVSSNTLASISANVKYASNDVNMAGDMVIPSRSGSSQPAWTACATNTSNWLLVEFPNPYLLNPGDFVEVIYKGKVNGDLGKLINSFSFKALKEDIQETQYFSSYSKIEIENTAEGCTTTPIKGCTYCASFELIKDEKYLVSGWVREESVKKPNEQVKSFKKGFIKISFTDSSEQNIGDPIDFKATGNIIDGWQRIVGEFVVPSQTDDFHLELVNDNDSSTDANAKVVYFDDIRIIPSKGNMKSFVYDQKTQRLMSELDENNYSTFYEYDLEGGLIRIKKETEKGVFTIQETRSGSPIKKKNDE